MKHAAAAVAAAGVLLAAACEVPDSTARSGGAAATAAPSQPAVTVTHTAGSIRLAAGELTLEVTRAPFRVAFQDGAGAPLGGQVAGGAAGPGQAPLAFRSAGVWRAPTSVVGFQALGADRFRLEVATTEPGRTLALTISFPTPFRARIEAEPSPGAAVDRFSEALAATADEGLYGGGQRFNRLEMRGETASLWALHQNDVQQLPSLLRGQTDECPVPLVLSTRGYAVSFDTTARGELRFAPPGVAGATALEVEDERLAYFVNASPEPVELIGRAAGSFGRPRVPPKWFFAPAKWRDDVTALPGVPGEALLREDADQLRRHGIPNGAIWLDNPWDTGDGDFEFDAAHFPDPDRLIGDLAAGGNALVCWISPYLGAGTRALSEAQARGFAVGNVQRREHVDLTDPAARAWWRARLEALLRRGVKGIKADRGEDELGPGAVYASGRPDRLEHNRYPLLYAQTVAEAVRAVHGDQGVAIGRSGWSGAWAHWTALWTADNGSWLPDPKGLRADVRAHLTASLSGFAFVGGDAGGYVGIAKQLPLGLQFMAPPPVLLLRWVQFAALTPMLQVGGDGPHEVWDMEPHLPGATAIYRRYATLHVELFPYLYTLAHQAAATGAPLLRPLWTAAPGDPSLRDVDDVLLLGEDLLFAPVLSYDTGTVLRQVPLPPGEWFDLWTGAPVAGGRTVTRPCPLDTLPVYVRAGAVVPFNLREGDLLGLGPQELDRPDRLGLLVAPGGARVERELYDGTRVLVEPSGAGARVAVIGPGPRRLALRVYGARPVAVTLDGQALVERPLSELASRDGWTYLAGIGGGGYALVAAHAGATARLAVTR